MDQSEKCVYGEKCYRKNPEHVKKFHPEKLKEVKKRPAKRTQADVNKENSPADQPSTSHDVEVSTAKRPKTVEDSPKKMKPEKQVNFLKKDTPKPAGKLEVSPELRTFWEHAKTLNKDHPRAAFSDIHNAELVGIFEQLNEELVNLTEDELRVNRRFATDLPEMNTCMTCDTGRYVVWRDIPGSEDFLVLHVSNEEHFPKMELVGDKFVHMILHLIGKKNAEGYLPKETNIEGLRKEVKTVVSKRNKKKLGHSPNGIGLWVPVKNDVGYREIAEDPARLKRTITSFGTSLDEESKKKYMTKIIELVTYVQFANDECDFGMGLELGYWLFLSNYAGLDDLALKMLSTAYELLDRDEYSKVLKTHFAKGRRGV